MILTAVILEILGFVLLSSQPFLAILLIFAGFLLLVVGIIKRKTKPKFEVSISVEDAPTPRTEATQKLMDQQKPIGNIDAVCPYCGKPLSKKPARKTKCPHCEKFIFVRTRPSDEQKVLVTDAQVEEIEEQWAIVNGTHDLLLADKQRFAEVKAALSKQFGKEASDQDVRWSILNQNAMRHATQHKWGFYRCDRFDMGEHLKKEGKDKQALLFFLEVCYLDLNGPNNIGTDDPEILREFPAWNPQEATDDLAPGVLNRASSIITALGLNAAEVEEMYLKQTSKLHKNLRLPLHPADAWPKIRDSLFG